MAKNKFSIEINTDDLNDDPKGSKSPYVNKGASAQKYARGLPTGKSVISTTNFNARRYGANAMDARDMWKDPAMLRQLVDLD